MLNQFLEKPENYRRKVAFIATGIIGIIIFSIWLIISKYRIKQTFNHKAPVKTATQQFKETLPSLKNNQSITTELMKQNQNIETK